MPGITLLMWPPEDLRDAIVHYIQKRGSFAAAGSETGDLILAVKTWLILRAPDRYVYHLHLEADLSKPGQAPMKTYVADAETVGSSVRWVTASDEEPINTATGAALHQLLSQIESDRGHLLEPHTPATRYPTQDDVIRSTNRTDEPNLPDASTPPTGNAVRPMGTIGPQCPVVRLTIASRHAADQIIRSHALPPPLILPPDVRRRSLCR